jgi:hypothetical protein
MTHRQPSRSWGRFAAGRRIEESRWGEISRDFWRMASSFISSHRSLQRLHFSSKCSKNRLVAELRPDPLGEVYMRSPVAHRHNAYGHFVARKAKTVNSYWFPTCFKNKSNHGQNIFAIIYANSAFSNAHTRIKNFNIFRWVLHRTPCGRGTPPPAPTPTRPSVVPAVVSRPIIRQPKMLPLQLLTASAATVDD